jgi:hypothetical protein
MNIDTNNSYYKTNDKTILAIYYNDDNIISSYGLYCYYDYTSISYKIPNNVIEIKYLLLKNEQK